MSFPATHVPEFFAHQRVGSRAFLETPVTQIGCMVSIKVSEADRALSPSDFAAKLLRPAERILLDAMGHRTFSSFLGVSFDPTEDGIEINAWQLIALDLSAPPLAA